MQDIEIQALETYQKNLQYLEEDHKSLYDKIILLEAIIEEGKYTEKYALEYKDEGYFDIQELSTGNYLYNENSIDHAKLMANSVDLKRTGGVFKALRLNYMSDEQANLVDKSELTFHNALWATIKLTNYTNKFAIPDTYMKKSYKVIFLEIGLGLHIQEIVEKLGSQVIFIKEENLETFRLSLFVTDYKKLSYNRFIHFCIAYDESEEREAFVKFLDHGNNYNLNIKHIPFSKSYQSQLQRLQEHVLSQSFINYGYSAELFRFINSPTYLVQGYSFLNLNHKNKDNIFASKPVLLVFSGPSTANNITWLQENRHRFIVVSALSTCRLLQNANLTPDIIIHIDPGEATALLFEGLDTKEYFKNTIAILASNVNEDTISKFERSKIHLIEQGTQYKKGFGQLSAPSVGEYTYALSLLLGAIDIYLLGIDLALDSKTFQTHGGFHTSQRTISKSDTVSASLDPSSSMQFIRGNFTEQVPTLPKFKTSIYQFEIFTDMLKREKHHVYNLSDGAYLEGTQPLKIEDDDWKKLEILDSTETIKEVTNFLQSISSDEFRKEDRDILKYQIKEAKKLEKTIKFFAKKKFANEDAYLSTVSKLAWDLSDMTNKTHADLSHVYYEYFQVIQSYIYDLFNTKELTNSNKHITQINKILIAQLYKISQLYITKMENYLK